MSSVEHGYCPASRNRLRRLAVALVAAYTALALQSGSIGAADPESAPENEIRSAIEEWRSAFNDGDEERVCNIFAPDIVANYQGEPGRDYDSLCEMLRSALRDRDATYRYSVLINDIMIEGDSAVVRLVWKLQVAKAGSSNETLEEPAVDIFRRQADGSWKISRYLAYPGSR